MGNVMVNDSYAQPNGYKKDQQSPPFGTLHENEMMKRLPPKGYQKRVRRYYIISYSVSIIYVKN